MAPSDSTGPSHWFAEMRQAWLVGVRTVCSCGWHSRARLNPDRAADDLIRHQVEPEAGLWR